MTHGRRCAHDPAGARLRRPPPRALVASYQPPSRRREKFGVETPFWGALFLPRGLSLPEIPEFREFVAREGPPSILATLGRGRGRGPDVGV